MGDIAAIIPARMGSKRIKMKNLKNLRGIPLIAWTINALRKSDIFDGNIYVSTEDFRIEDVAHNYGAKIIPRPSELANDTIHIDASIIHAVKYLRDKGKDFTYIGIFQPTTPFRKPIDIKQGYNKIKEECADSLFYATELKRFIWTREPKPINYDYKNRPRSQDKVWELVETGDYITKSDTLLKYNNRFGGKISYYITSPLSYFDLDTPLDWKIAESSANGFNHYGI